MLRSGRVCGGRHPAAECVDKRRITVEQAAEVALPELVLEPVIAVADVPRPSSVTQTAASSSRVAPLLPLQRVVKQKAMPKRRCTAVPLDVEAIYDRWAQESAAELRLVSGLVYVSPAGGRLLLCRRLRTRTSSVAFLCRSLVWARILSAWCASFSVRDREL